MPDYRTIVTKHGVTAGVVPSGLTQGELAVNIADAILFVGGTAGNAIPIVSGGGGGGITGPYVVSLNGITGTVGLSAGSNITITSSGKTLIFSSSASGNVGFTYSASPPVSPSIGFRWIDSETGKEYVWVNDGTSTQWIQPMIDSVVGATGATGPQGIQGNTGATGAIPTNFVASLNGATGAITNVARTNEGNTFSVIQVMNSGITTANLFVSGGATFSGNAFFASGASFGGTAQFTSIVLANGEFLSNSTNGFIELGPNGTHPSSPSLDFYSLVVDGVNYGSGISMGTRNTRTGALNTGNINFYTPVGVQNSTNLALGSSSWYTLSYREAAGMACATIGLLGGHQVSSSSGSLVLVTNNQAGASTRVPVTNHTNPNLYIYANGATRASDFIRFEHDTNFGQIVSGGTSGIQIVPGSGTLGVSGGITASRIVISGGATFNGGIGFADGTTQETASSRITWGGGARIMQDGITNGVIQNPDFMISNTISDGANFGPTGSFMMNLSPFTFTTRVNLRKMVTMQGGSPSGNTGSFKYVVYDSGITTGRPTNLMYESSVINMDAVNTFARYFATMNVTLNAGTYWAGFLFNIPSGKTLNGANYSWGVVQSAAGVWEGDHANRLMNDGNMSHLRYRMDGMTAYNPLTYGFTASLPSGSHPSIGFGTSEVYATSRHAWVGVMVQR